MSILTDFFSVTRRNLNSMVTWRDSAPVAEFWEMFDRAAQEAQDAIVSEIARSHGSTWRDRPESYWFAALVEEIGELGSSLNCEHEHTPDWELKQIASICINWLDKRAAEQAQLKEISR